jgi:hypothetical protein
MTDDVCPSVAVHFLYTSKFSIFRLSSGLVAANRFRDAEHILRPLFLLISTCMYIYHLVPLPPHLVRRRTLDTLPCWR